MPRSRPPLPYLFIDDEQRTLSEIERILSEGAFREMFPAVVRLGQIGDGNKRRPTIHEFTCEMEGGLLAVFRADEHGIPQAYSQVPVASHSARHHGAFVASHSMGVDLCPASSRRKHPTLGQGTLTALIFGEPFLQVDMATHGRKTVARRVTRRPTALAEAYLFDYAVGSGQRVESSFIVDGSGFVVSQCHHEAFSWTENRRLEMAFRNTPRSVSQAYWHAFISLLSGPYRERLGVILKALGACEMETFFSTYDTVCRKRLIGETQIEVV
ncbi:MAG: hypothetical protein WA001_01750 [Patescibacteria group bacterium]